MSTRPEYVNEKTTSKITIAFTDPDGAAAVPNSARYRVDCLTNDQEVRDWTDIESPGASATITLNETDNTIINTAQSETSGYHESRLVTVEATYGTGDLCTSEYEYYVKSLRRYP